MRTPLPRVNAMSRIVRRLALRCAFVAVCAAGLAPAVAAAAQWYDGQGARRPPPLYPYELQPGQSYAVEVAPGTYVIHHPAQRRAYPAARRHIRRTATPRPKRTHANRALIEELRRRDARQVARHAAAVKRAAARRAARKAAKKSRAEKVAKRAAHKADKTAGRKPDKIIRTRKVVRDKPLVIVTRRVVEDPPKVITRRHYVDDPPPGARNEDPRVIHADAEITILGPDRMSIRLVRKQGEPLVVVDPGSKPVVMPKRQPKHIKSKRIEKRFKARK